LLIFHNPVAKRARHAAFGGITPAKPGSAQAKLARQAQNVKVFHILIFYGFVGNSTFECLNLLLQRNTQEVRISRC
jgi:hypothetical protein